MAAETYTDQQEYAKHNVKKSSSCSKCGSDDSCGCEKEECGCCPKGLIMLYDDAGRPQGCITPNDYELLQVSSHDCESGFIKLYENATGKFFGCVPSAEYSDIYATVNGSIS